MARSILGSKGGVTLPTIGTPGDPQEGDEEEFVVRRWNATFDREILDDSSFVDANNWFVGVGGMYGLTGSCEGQAQAGLTMGIYDFSTAGVAGTANFVLTSFSACTYTFTGLVTRINIVTPKTGLIMFTIDFVSCGSIVVA